MKSNDPIEVKAASGIQPSYFKSALRRKIAALKKNACAGDLQHESKMIVQRITSLPIFRAAINVGAYLPVFGEPDILPLFDVPAKKFFIPAFDENTGSYRLAELMPELHAGKFGIPEPPAPAFAGANEIHLLIVPGVAFDAGGRRLGRGGGFYDRILSLYTAPVVGVCFNFQIMDFIPQEPHDRRTSFVVSGDHFFSVCG